MHQQELIGLWQEAKNHLKAQLEQRKPCAVFLEGSVAEGFGNKRSDIDFVAIIDDGTEVATMPYILFINDRRVEVRLLSRDRLQRELTQLKTQTLCKAGTLSSDISWNMLERCQRFMGSTPIFGDEIINNLKLIMGDDIFTQSIRDWFDDFSRQCARYSIAQSVIGNDEAAISWMKTAVHHGAKRYVSTLGERYVGSKWLSLQMERAQLDNKIINAFESFYHEQYNHISVRDYLAEGIHLLDEFGVVGIELDETIVLQSVPDVTSWKIGKHIHIVRKNVVFRVGDQAARVWRSISWGKSVQEITAAPDLQNIRSLIAKSLQDFSLASLITLAWGEKQEVIRVGIENFSQPPAVTPLPLVSVNGATLEREEHVTIQQLPLSAAQFAEAGVNLTWANIGVENSIEDSDGAMRKGQWGVLEYTTLRIVQTSSMLVLASRGVTPQPPLEDVVSIAKRIINDEAIVQRINDFEKIRVTDKESAEVRFNKALDIIKVFRNLAQDENFPASFDSKEGWCETILYGYDWINLATHLDTPFPPSAAGGKGTAEEARDLLASKLGA